MEVDKKIIRNPMNMEPKTILTENQIKFILSKNNKLSAVMNNLNKSKADCDGSSSSSTTSTSLPVNELGKMLLNYSKEGNAEKILKLIQEGAPFISDWLGMSALHFAAMYNHPEVLEVLLKSGHNKDTRTKVDRTPLHLAAYHGHKDVIEALLKVDCDVNARDMLRMTPLHWAVERGHNEVVELLLKYGGDVDAISKFEKTPLSIAIQTGQTELLKDLQNARDIMRSRPQITDQIQNETNAAVNSIMLDNNEEDIYLDEEGDIKLQNMKTEPEEVQESKEEFHENLSTLDMVKKLKSMMSVEEADDTLLTSALQNGRQLVLTEGGKLALNDAKIRPETNVSIENHRKQIHEDDKHKKQFSVKPKSVSLKPSSTKNVKILSMDTFKKMYGQNALGSIQNQNIYNNNITKGNIRPGMHLTKLTRVAHPSEINVKKTIFNPIVPSNSSNVVSINNKSTIPTQFKTRIEEKEDDLSSIIEICTENDSDQDQEIDEISNNSNSNSIEKQRLISISSNGSIRNFTSNINNNNHNNNNVNEIEISSPSTSSFHVNSNQQQQQQQPPPPPPLQQVRNNVVQLLDIPEICRQLQDLRKSNEVLRRELELTRIENEEYKMRLERLECKIDEQELRLS